VNLAIEATYAFLKTKALDLTSLPLLRIYWYDGAIGGRLSTEQLLLAQHNDVKLRLGVVNGLGQQKEVDTKIVTDLAELARNKAICDAILIGGDGDLRLGIELAQQFGVRVHLLTIEGSSFSESLRMEADTWAQIEIEQLRAFLSVAAPSAAPEAGSNTAMGQALARAMDARQSDGDPPAATQPQPSPPAAAAPGDVTETLRSVVSEYLGSLPEGQRANLISAAGGPTRTIPTDHDRPLLWRAGQAMNAQLDTQQKRMLRDELRRQLGIIRD
jgi:uncharacterized LabA/DUF88 family protein